MLFQQPSDGLRQAKRPLLPLQTSCEAVELRGPTLPNEHPAAHEMNNQRGFLQTVEKLLHVMVCW